MPLYTPGRRRAILLLLLTSVLLLTLDLRGNAMFDAARSGFSNVLEPIEAAADVVTRPVQDAWRGITDYDEVAKENQRLREQLDAARSDQITAQAAIVEYRDLLALNSLPSLADYPTVVATVVGQSPSNLDQVIEINKGTNDGIEVGMAVVNEAGLVGKITSALPDRARVMLITDARYAVNVKIVPAPAPPTTTTTAPAGPGDATTVPADVAAADGSTPAGTSTTTTPSTTTTTTTTTVPPEAGDDGSSTSTTSSTTTTTIDPDTPRETGRLSGQGPGRLPQVDFLADTPSFGRLARGDAIFTTGGADSLAPLDIPVGIVTNLVTRSTAQGPLLEVEPLADLDKLHFVRVVIYKPVSEAGPPAADGQATGG